MAPPGVERAFLDTSILLAATDEARPERDAALAALEQWPAAGIVLYTSGQVLREYLVVATRPVSSNGLGMTRADSIANTMVLGRRLRHLAEDSKVHDRLISLVTDVGCRGKRIHDANVVATMLVHGVDTVATLNAGDFAGFGDHVRVIGLER